MKNMDSISVVIPALITSDKQLALSVRCIENARNKTKIPFNLIIVETCSDYLMEYADVYVREKEKTTATKSINRGFSVAGAGYVVLLTNDVIVGDGWLDALLDCFKLDDCGLATLATTQFNHRQEDKIEEGIWFSLAMMPKEYARFDEGYVNSWDDTDLIMRVYLDGKKMYRNYNVVVDHAVGATQYEQPDHQSNYNKNHDRFVGKYADHKNHRMYKILTEGTVI